MLLLALLLLVQEILKVHGWEKDYPLFTTVSRIINGYCPPSDIVNFLEVRPLSAVVMAVVASVNSSSINSPLSPAARSSVVTYNTHTHTLTCETITI
jgi:hypothetical protein